jgi:hypothetical protein
MTMTSQYQINLVDISLGFCGRNKCCHFCSWSHQTLYPSCRVISCLFLLCQLTVVCQPGNSDRENYLEQLLAEMESWKFLASPNLLHSLVHSSLLHKVHPCKWDIHRERTPPIPPTCSIISLFPEFSCPWLYLLANICEMLSCCLSMSSAHKTSSVQCICSPTRYTMFFYGWFYS